MNARDISREKINAALAGISGARLALIGDICLDAYWHADMRLSELSRETPHFPLPIISETYSPGAGGNAAANMAALKPESLYLLGAVGRDWRADKLLEELKTRGIDVSGVVRDESIMTNAYIKPMRRGISGVVYEDARLDFVNRTPISARAEEKLIAALRDIAGRIDCLCVADQLACGAITENVRAEINALAASGLAVIVDSRDNISKYFNCLLKPNEVELARAMGAGEAITLAGALARANRADVLATLGENGCVLVSAGETVEMGAERVEGEIDICGAGDTFLSALACALAGGADIKTAMAISTLASSVTIKKLGETGTAARGEILNVYDGGIGK